MKDKSKELILNSDEVDKDDTLLVGGKGSSLGELQKLREAGVKVPNFFCTTAYAFTEFIESAKLKDGRTIKQAIRETLEDLGIPGPEELKERQDRLRELISGEGVPEEVVRAVTPLLETTDTTNLLSRWGRAEEIVKRTEMTDEIKNALRSTLDTIDTDDLARRGEQIREYILSSGIVPKLVKGLFRGYERLSEQYGPDCDVAVRSSATAEDLPDASFAGQQDTYLNIRGKRELLGAVVRCAASLYTDRAISYREKYANVHPDFDPFSVRLAVVVQKMVRSDLGASGIMFTRDSKSGHDKVIEITAGFGLGELVVGGMINPDRYLVGREELGKIGPDGRELEPIVCIERGEKQEKMIYKEGGGTERVVTSQEERSRIVLSKEEILTLAKWAKLIEEHYGRPMDIEWAKDGLTGELFIVQARSETVHVRKDPNVIEEYLLDERAVREAKLIARGTSPLSTIGKGRVRKYTSIDELRSKERRNKKLIYGGMIAGEIIDDHERMWLRDKLKAKLIDDNVEVTDELLDRRLNELVRKIRSGIAIEHEVKLEWSDRVLERGDILVTTETYPAWEPYMVRASGIITERGGPQAHAAIICREHDIPGLVAVDNAMGILEDGQSITIDGIEGTIYEGLLPHHVRRTRIDKLPSHKTKVKMIIGDPKTVLDNSLLPNDGVGLARMEMIFGSIGVHPMALLNYDKLKRMNELRKKGADRSTDEASEYIILVDMIQPTADLDNLDNVLEEIDRRTHGYEDKAQWMIDELARGIGMFGVAFHGKHVLLRMSDFKSNEYRGLVGGEFFEPVEGNPMIALRGAARYTHPSYEEAFKRIECEAVRKVRERMGYTNVHVMIPFCRSPEELRSVLEVMREAGLEQGKDGLEVWVMCEIPTNALRANDFLEIIKPGNGGFSLGTNDLTQLTMGVDRDSGDPYLVEVGNPNDLAVKKAVAMAVRACNDSNLPIGLCGNIVTDDPNYCEFLLRSGSEGKGMESVSVFPSRVIDTIMTVAKVEEGIARGIEVEIPQVAGMPAEYKTPETEKNLVQIDTALSSIGIHPMAILNYDELKRLHNLGTREPEDLSPNEALEFVQLTDMFRITPHHDIGRVNEIIDRIEEVTKGHENKVDWIVNAIARKIEIPRKEGERILISMSNLDSSDFRNLIGGKLFEIREENPSMGIRGAARHIHPSYEEAFRRIECEVVKGLREKNTNVHVMIPFCRSPEELRSVLKVMREAGLEQGKDGLEVWIGGMVPSTALRADEFLSVVNGGICVDKEELTQLTLGVSHTTQDPRLKETHNPEDPAVNVLVTMMNIACRNKGRPISLLPSVTEKTPIPLPPEKLEPIPPPTSVDYKAGQEKKEKL